VDWPDGAHAALLVVVDLSPACGPGGIEAKDLETEDTEFGMAVGFERVLTLLERHRITATFAVPAIVAEVWPAHVREIVARGHEVAAHGDKHEDPSTLERDEEQRRIARTTETLAALAGVRPGGWFTLPRPGERYAGGQISPHTVDLLIDAGYEYLGNSQADDIPHYWVTDFATRRSLLALPYYFHFDDQFFLMFPAPGTGSNLERPAPLLKNWTQELDAARTFGRCFTMIVHPRLIGWGNRLAVLEQVLARARTGSPLWNVGGLACARWFTRAYPASTTLRLEPSTWQDVPGSLS
jgi:peptidoglycan/xylan/chitin deacetylase (PgdA/CDA1 family)